MVITIQATNIDLTVAIREYTEDKFQSLTKYFENIQQVNIDVGMRTHHHAKGKVYYAEVNIVVPGHTLRVSKDAENLYKAIDKVKDHFKVELEKMKGKMRTKNRTILRQNKGYKE